MKITPLNPENIANYDDIEAFINTHIAAGTPPRYARAVHQIVFPYLASSVGPLSNQTPSDAVEFNRIAAANTGQQDFFFAPENADRIRIKMVADWICEHPPEDIDGLIERHRGKHINDLMEEARQDGLSLTKYKDMYPETTLYYLCVDKKGRVVNDEGQKTEVFRSFFQDAPEDLKDRLLDGMPHGTSMFIEIRGSGREISLDIDYKGDHGNFNFNRSFDFQQRCVHHAGANCAGAVQGMGIHKALQQRFFALYEKLDVQMVTVTANEVGAYAWAKLGFVPSPKDWHDMKENIEKRIDFMAQTPDPKNGEVLPAKYADFLKRVLDSKDPRALWMLVDQGYEYAGHKVGKLLTISWMSFPDLEADVLEGMKNIEDYPYLYEGFCWSGTLGMNDAECRKRLDSYLYPEQPKQGRDATPSSEKRRAGRPSL